MSQQAFDIYKASAIIIVDRKVLATRTRGESIWFQLGGKLKKDADGNYVESETQAVARECKEEIGVEVEENTLEKIGDFYAEAAGKSGKVVKIAAYLVHNFVGEPKPNEEVEEIRGFNSTNHSDVELASILHHDIIPAMVTRGLVD